MNPEPPPARVWMDGRLLPAAEACVPVDDRGFLYGDGLFETLRVYGGRPFRWTAHLRRLVDGAQRAGIALRFTEDQLRSAALGLVEAHAPEGLLRLQLSRGSGPRGYSARGASHPRCVMSFHALPPALDPGAPAGVHLTVSRLRAAVPADLDRCKSTSKFLHVLARTEAENRGADEALLLNPRDEVAESDSANFFWVDGDQICTPPLSSGALDGITRACVIQLCGELGLPWRERSLPASRLPEVQSAFLTSSAREIVPVRKLEARDLIPAAGLGLLRQAYRRLVDQERAAGD